MSDCVTMGISKLENELFLFVQNFTVEPEGPWPLRSKSLIGGKCQVQLISLYTRVEGLRDQWSLYGWKTFMWFYMACNGWWCIVYQILHQAHLKEVAVTQNWEIMTLKCLTTMRTYCLEGPHEQDGNEIAFGWKAGPYVFTLHLKFCDRTEFNFKNPWYSLCMSLKGPHNFMVTALGHSVKWP